jgi:hypothetical protein
MEHIDLIAQKLMIIAGIPMYILGIIGNILNIYVFTIWSRSSKPRNEINNIVHPSNIPLYLLTSSCANLILILYPLLTRIIYDGYKYRIGQNNVFILCKFRYYVLYTCDLISLTCICMATLDRYLISSRNVRLRRLSTTRKRTKQIVLIIICLFVFHNIPIGIYFEVSNLGQCFIFSNSYSYYYLYVLQISLHGIIPICFLSIFGILTYKQLRMINRQSNMNMDKQSSRMILLMSITIVLSSIPYCIEQLYYLIVSDDSNEISSIVFLCHVIASILFYTNPVCSFYVYYISTPNFRRQVCKLIQCNRNSHHFSNQVHVTVIPLTVSK